MPTTGAILQSALSRRSDRNGFRIVGGGIESDPIEEGSGSLNGRQFAIDGTLNGLHSFEWWGAKRPSEDVDFGWLFNKDNACMFSSACYGGLSNAAATGSPVIFWGVAACAMSGVLCN